MEKIAVTKLREELSETLNKVAFAGQRVVIDRNGKNIAAMVSIRDLERLHAFESDERTRRLGEAREKIHGHYGKTFDRLANE